MFQDGNLDTLDSADMETDVLITDDLADLQSEACLGLRADGRHRRSSEADDDYNFDFGDDDDDADDDDDFEDDFDDADNDDDLDDFHQ